MNDEQIRKLQNVELEMLKTVLAICREAGIRHYAMGGTLLGAVRHQGFIPWDDDIDVGIPRRQYEEFLRLAKERLPEHLKLSYFRGPDDPGRPTYYCQILNTDVKITQYIANEPIRTYAWIDIFPLDAMPDNALLRKIHSCVLLYRRMRVQLSMFDRNVHQHRANRPWYEKLIMKIYTLTGIGSGSDPRDMMEKLDASLRRYSLRNEHWLINFMGAWKLKEMFPVSWYGKGVKLPFEDIELNCPAHYHEVLTQMYGDYMTPVNTKAEKYDHHSIFVEE